MVLDVDTSVLRTMTAPLGAAVVVVGVAPPPIGGGVYDHPAPTLAAEQNPTGEFPGPVRVGRGLGVVLDDFARTVHPFSGYTGTRHRHGHPLRARLLSHPALAAVS